MRKIKLVLTAFLTVVSGNTILAGGILTNTNQNIAFNRNMARDGIIAIDGVYSNPAGVAFMPKGFHLSLNNQSAFQTRTIQSGITIPGLEGTPYYQPFKMNGGNENGIKEFKGEAAAPILPSIQFAYVDEKWSFQAGFGLVGGGGKCTFNHGLGSFERTISLLPMMMNSINEKYKQFPELANTGLGLGTTTPGYSVESYIHGQQYVFGMQVGGTYKLTENLSVYGGFRFNYIYNKYKGNIKNIAVNINGTNENLVDYINTNSPELAQVATMLGEKAQYYQNIAEQTHNADAANAAQKYATGAQGIQSVATMKGSVADKYLDCTQTGWSIDPIIGIDYKWDKLNIGARLEFTTHFNIQNDTRVDDTGLFADGVNTPGDMPGLFTIGAQYEVLPRTRVMAGFHYFFDKNARMDKDKQKALSHNTMEWNAGVEYDLLKNVLVSAGWQRTNYGLGNGSFLNDMSFVTSSNSFGFGGAVRVAENVKVNVAYFWTKYSTFHKEYDQTFAAAGQEIVAHCTDDFTRTNKVFGVGVDIDF